jgi:inner membrane protease ATP23
LEQQKLETQQQQHDKCNEYVHAGLTRDVTVQFLMNKLIGLGCKPPAGFINCLDCGERQAGGGFGVVEEQEIVTINNKNANNNASNDGNLNNNNKTSTRNNNIFSKIKQKCNPLTSPQELQDKLLKEENNNNNNNQNTKIQLRLLPQIFLCQNHVMNQTHVNQSLIHELIHAIDLCRTNMDPIHNCIHMACTEIRAENLSGECNMGRELMHYSSRIMNDAAGLKGHGAKCVKRRAVLSVKANPNCVDRAEEYVDVAFDRCFKDTYPFDRHPNLR